MESEISTERVLTDEEWKSINHILNQLSEKLKIEQSFIQINRKISNETSSYCFISGTPRNYTVANITLTKLFIEQTTFHQKIRLLLHELTHYICRDLEVYVDDVICNIVPTKDKKAIEHSFQNVDENVIEGLATRFYFLIGEEFIDSLIPHMPF